MHNVKIAKQVIIAFAAVAVLTSCAIVGSLFGPRVLEKSKEQTPQWVSVKPSQVEVSPSGFRYHGVALDQLDLPLGVKRAQLAATNLSELAIIDEARREVARECGVRPNAAGSKNEVRLDLVVAAAIKKEFGAAVRVADIYYEKVEVPDSAGEAVAKSGAVYNIHVLIDFPREQFTAALRNAGATLKRESSVESRRCGKSLLSRFAAPQMPGKASR